jgi:hypothetical protein
MRYRFEKLPDDKFVVRNVETDVIIGSAVPVWKEDPCNPDRSAIVGYSVLNRQGKELGTSRMRRYAAMALAIHEEYYGYPSFRKCARRCPEPDRHDLMRRASGLGKPSSSSLAKAVWLAVERKPAAVIASRIHWLKPSKNYTVSRSASITRNVP